MTPPTLTQIDCRVDSALNLGQPTFLLGQDPIFADETPFLPITNSAAPWLEQCAVLLRQGPTSLEEKLSHVTNVRLPTHAGPTKSKRKRNSDLYEANTLASDGSNSDLQGIKEQTASNNMAKRLKVDSDLSNTKKAHKEKADGKRWSVPETKKLLEALLGPNSAYRELFRTSPNHVYKEVALLVVGQPFKLTYIRYRAISSTRNGNQLPSSLVIIDSLPSIN